MWVEDEIQDAEGNEGFREVSRSPRQRRDKN
jgi:hypothetical protein